MKPHKVTDADNTTILANVTEDKEGKQTESKDSKFDNDLMICKVIIKSYFLFLLYIIAIFLTVWVHSR